MLMLNNILRHKNSETSLTQTFEKPVDPPVFILVDGFKVLLHPQLKKPWEGVTDWY